MAIAFTKVIDSGPSFVTVQASDGQVYTLNGTAAWRANNPGNLRPGSLTNNLGAIGVMDTGSNGKFLVFPDRETGAAAVPKLLFETQTYSSKSILDAFKKYAPTADHNDPSAYAGRLAAAAGVDVNTRMSDLTPSQRQALLAAQPSVENNTPGTIKGVAGVPVPAEVVQQFSGAPLPAVPVNPLANAAAAAGGAARLAPLPAPAPLTPQSMQATPLQRAFSRLQTAQSAAGGAITPTPVAAAPSNMVKLASGQLIASGTYPSNDGNHMVQITNDGHGNAVVTKVVNPGETPGLIDPLRESKADTVAGGVVRATIQAEAAKKAQEASAVVGNTFNSAKQTASNAVSNIGSTAQNAFNGLGSLFGNNNALKATPTVSTGATAALNRASNFAPTYTDTRAEQALSRVTPKPAAVTVAPAKSNALSGASLLASGAATARGTTASGSATLKPAGAGIAALGANMAGGVASRVTAAPVVKPTATVSLADIQARQQAATAAAAASQARLAAAKAAAAPIAVPVAPAQQSNNGAGNIPGFDANAGTWYANDAPGQHGSNHDAAH